jgi:hypothetical protein
MNEPRPLLLPHACRPLGRALTAAYTLALVLAAGGARAGAPPGEAPQGKAPQGEAPRTEAPPGESSWVEAPPAATPKAAPKVETNVVTPKAAPPKTEAGAPKAEAYALGWTRLAGGEPCIGPRDLALDVEKALGRRVFVSAARAARSIEGRIGPRLGGGWAATVQVIDADGTVAGTRELSTDGAGCRELDETITLSVALLVDASASAGPDAVPEPGPGAKAAAPPRGAAPKPRRDEWFEASLSAGYMAGDRIFPHADAHGDGLGGGGGVRAGRALRSGLWLGGSYTYFHGGMVNVDRGVPGPEFWSLGRRRFRAHAVGAELGYRFALGPFEARPYVGVGVAIFDFADGSTYISTPGSMPYESSPGMAGSSPHLALSAWPGVALTLPLGETVFIGVDARWVTVAGAPEQNNVGAFAYAGLRF